MAASFAVVPTVEGPRCSDQRRFHRPGGADHDRERVAAGVDDVENREPLPVVGEPHVARRIDRDRRDPNQGVARIAGAVRRNRFADLALGGGAVAENGVESLLLTFTVRLNRSSCEHQK